MSKQRRKDYTVEYIDPNTLDYGDVPVDPEVELTLSELGPKNPAVLDRHSNVVLSRQKQVAAAVFLGWSTVACVREFG